MTSGHVITIWRGKRRNRHVDQQSCDLPPSKHRSRWLLYGFTHPRHNYSKLHSLFAYVSFLEQDELLFVTSLLKSHAGQAFDPKDVFSIVDSSAVKKKSSTNVCRWKRIVTGGNLDYSVSRQTLCLASGEVEPLLQLQLVVPHRLC